MNILTQRHLSRRTVLQGAGASIALPFLEAMRPVRAAGDDARSPWRMAVVYVPNGIVMNDWLPENVASELSFPPILQPLESLREHFTIISGLSNEAASKTRGGAHAKASGSFLSGMPTKHTAGADVRAGSTFDQLAAARWGSETRVPSPQLGCEDSRMVGNYQRDSIQLGSYTHTR